MLHNQAKGTMFVSKVNPSPTRSSIKEANDHLHLLHHRVLELEKTVQEQAEALIKKDELMQIKMRELSETKDSEIIDLQKRVEAYEERIRKLEQTVREREIMIDHLSHKCILAEEVTAHVPSLERLLVTIKKLPVKVPSVRHGSGSGSSSASRPRSRLTSRTHAPKTETRNSTVVGNSRTVHDGIIDGHLHIPNQNMAEMRIGRSFNINSNFSMSEDEGDNSENM